MKNVNTNPIGIFDSGIGGLTVVKRVNQYLPNENVVYFGDTARVPYGTKSNETVIEYSLQNSKFLISKNVKMIVVACNTASSVALEVMRSKFDVPIIGMIMPGAKMALQKSFNNKIGVIGTYATINNNKAYSTELKKINPDVEVIEKPCPLFVPLAEEGWIRHEATYAIAEEYLKDFIKAKVDTLILGCTHYPILSEVIQDVMGNDVTLIDSGTAASAVIESKLSVKSIKNNSSEKGQHEYYVTDVPTKFKEVAELFLGREIEQIQKLDNEVLQSF